jgi:hypothetical protein
MHAWHAWRYRLLKREGCLVGVSISERGWEKGGVEWVVGFWGGGEEFMLDTDFGREEGGE